MKLNQRVINSTIAATLGLAVVSLGFFAYKQKVQADTILPGFSTAHLSIHVTVPQATSINISAKFMPTNGSGRYYFKDRSFDLPAGGLNTIDWYIRKIPGQQYNLTVTSNGKALTNSPAVVMMSNDQLVNTGGFDLFIGQPAAPVSSPVVEDEEEIAPPEETATPEMETEEDYNEQETETESDGPPVPVLPSI